MGCCGGCGGEDSTSPKEQEKDQVKDQEQEQNTDQEQAEVTAQNQQQKQIVSGSDCGGLIGGSQIGRAHV